MNAHAITILVSILRAQCETFPAKADTLSSLADALEAGTITGECAQTQWLAL